MKQLVHKFGLCILFFLIFGGPIGAFAEQRAVPVSYSAVSSMVNDLIENKTSINLGRPSPVQTGDATTLKLQLLLFLLLLLVFFVLVWKRRNKLKINE